MCYKNLVQPQSRVNLLTKYIGQIILINAKHDNDVGLYQGNMGSAIYLYNLDKGKTVFYFHNFANDLISNINEKIGMTSSLYTSGSTGIAWGIKYLCENAFIDDDEVESILNNLDDICLSKTNSLQLDVDFYGICGYLLSRVNAGRLTEGCDLRCHLRLERIISMIDNLANTIFSDGYQHNNILEDIINYGQNPHQLRSNIEGMCNSTFILNRANKEGIYLEIVIKATTILHYKINDYLKILSDYILRTTRKEYVLLFFNFICRLHYSHLILSRDLNIDEKFDFFGLLSILSEKMNKLESQTFNCQDEIFSATALFRIYQIDNNEVLGNFIDRKMSTLLVDLYDNRKLEQSIYPGKYPLNLGLTGIAGLGMIFLQWMKPEISNWDESLLISQSNLFHDI